MFCAMLAPLLGAAIYFVSQGTRASPSLTPAHSVAPESESARAPSASSLRVRAVAEARGAVRRQRRHEARREDPSSELAPPAEPARDAQAAVGVAERFWAAFSRYQVGELGPGVKRELSATGTRGFARRLLRAPPRVPAGGGSGGTQRLGGLDFVPRRYRGRALVGAEVVGEVIGGRERGPLAFELEREREGWRVAALAR